MAQCNIQMSQGGQGVTYYMEPELVAQSPAVGVGFSVQTFNDAYYLAVTYQFVESAQPTEEKIAITLRNGSIYELDMYTMEVASQGGIHICAAVFFLPDELHEPLKSKEMAFVKFRTADEVVYHLPVSSNADVLVRHLKCFYQ